MIESVEQGSGGRSPLRARSALELLRREPLAPQRALAALGALSLGLLLLSTVTGPSWVPPGLQAVPLLLGGLVLGRNLYLRLLALCLLVVVVQVVTQDGSPPGALLVVAFTAALSYEFARSREALGLSGMRGDSVLLELRDRLTQQGQLPHLPAGWAGEALVLPAGGAPFAGDFVVSALLPGRLEVALVDVSGKGVEAGTRSLLLSGALGGLLGAQKTRPYLTVSNDYLIRQAWEEGFATAVHCVIDLAGGDYTVSSAGHPPAVHFDAGSGRWTQIQSAGPALGLLPDVRYEAVSGVLRPGDALLLYTDGLVEIPGRDLARGIDKLIGEAERLVTRGFVHGAAFLAEAVANGSDDRGLVLIWRERR